MICKCKSCKKRYVGCHSNCKDYAEFRRGLDEINKKIKEEKEHISGGWAFIPRKKRHKTN